MPTSTTRLTATCNTYKYIVSIYNYIILIYTYDCII